MKNTDEKQVDVGLHSPLKHRPSLMTQAEADLWKKENAEALEAWNEYVEKNGLPLARYRPF